MQEENEVRKKLCKKGAVSELGIALNEVEVGNEKIKDIKAQLKEDYGTEEADRIVQYARLIQKDNYQKEINKANALEEIHSEITGD